MTTAYPGPLATNTFDRQTIDSTKRPNNKSDMLKPSQEPERGTSPSSEDPKTDQTQTDTTTHGPPHYPMDPGHPTVPYNGPYSPDFLSAHHNVEDLFHLPVHSEKPISIPKEKSKSKSDSKKPVESLKPHKEMIDQYFPGPLAPDKFPDKATSMPTYSVNENQHAPGSSNKWAPSQKDRPSDHAQFIPLHPQPDTSSPGLSFAPSNGENISPVNFNKQYDNSAVGLPYQGSIPLKPDSIDPNVVVPPKKKTVPSNPFIVAEKSKPSSVLPDRPKQGQRNPDRETLPEQLYHLINSQHPGLIQLNHTPPQSYPGLYELHQQISSQKQPPGNRVQQPAYFGTAPTAPKKTKPHIFAQKDENGQTTYHIHTPDIPSTPQQIEELLAHINQHDPNPGPFQPYPGQPAVPHNVPNGGPPPNPPLHIDAHIPHSGLTHLNHPLAAQTPSQSGSFLIIRRNNVQNFAFDKRADLPCWKDIR